MPDHIFHVSNWRIRVHVLGKWISAANPRLFRYRRESSFLYWIAFHWNSVDCLWPRFCKYHSAQSNSQQISGICNGSDEASTQYTVSRTGIPFPSIASNCIKDIFFVVDFNGFSFVATHSLARQSSAMGNNANVFPATIWQNSDCGHRLLWSLYWSTN